MIKLNAISLNTEDKECNTFSKGLMLRRSQQSVCKVSFKFFSSHVSSRGDSQGEHYVQNMEMGVLRNCHPALSLKTCMENLLVPMCFILNVAFLSCSCWPSLLLFHTACWGNILLMRAVVLMSYRMVENEATKICTFKANRQHNVWSH